jgi:hypothetical protein
MVSILPELSTCNMTFGVTAEALNSGTCEGVNA